MATKSERERVEDAFRRTGCGWILEAADHELAVHRERDSLLDAVTLEIEEFRKEYYVRFGERPDPFDLLRENEEKAVAFFQSFTGPPMSVDARIVIWRLLIGFELLSLELNYKKRQGFQVRFVVGARHGTPDKEYTTDNPWDFSILRHLGMYTVSGKLVLDGYYALRD
jgi:hypothetical protein